MRRAPNYDAGNATAAAIILAGDPATFGAGLVEWARRWVSSHPPKARRWQRQAPPDTVGTAQRSGEQLPLQFEGQSEAA